MADTTQARWRVEVELSGTLGEQVHNDLVTLGMSVLCVNGIDRITYFSAARQPASAALAVQNWLNLATRTGLRINRVEVMWLPYWEAAQPPLSEQERTLLQAANA